MNTPLYRHPKAYAKARGEMDEFRDSYLRTLQCRNYLLQGMDGADRLDAWRELAEKAAERFGEDRVRHVLAATFQASDGDGRYDWKTRQAFSAYEFPELDNRTDVPFHPILNYALSGHPCKLNRLCREFLSLYPQEEEIWMGMSPLPC